jgi:2-hydroxychromene-2-carboxylate isomerase
MTQTLDVATDPAVREVTPPRITLLGDFNCPFSYLASRRAAVLAAHGLRVDWHAVEHAPWVARRYTDSSVRFACLQEEVDKVRSLLLPREELPFAPAGFLPYTKAAVTAYAEAYAAGRAAEVRRLLFDAFWLHGTDLGNARTVRALLVDALRAASSRSEAVREWGYAVDVTGGPVSTRAWRLVRQWREEWLATGKETVPTVVVDGGETYFGLEALEWLAAELGRRGIEPGDVPPSAPARPRPHVADLADHAWVSQHGNRWMRDFRDAATRPPFPHVS